jgi:hypothetical protein
MNYMFSLQQLIAILIAGQDWIRFTASGEPCAKLKVSGIPHEVPRNPSAA